MSQNEFSNFKFTGENWMPLNVLNSVKQAYANRCEVELPQMLISNLISNIVYLKDKRITFPGVSTLSGSEVGKPAVIVAPGPSLDKHLDLLRKHQQNLVIIALDAALPVLDKHGIVPRYVAVIDPTDRQANNFKGIGVSLNFFTTVVPSIVHPKVLELLDPDATVMYNLDHPQSPIHLAAAKFTGDLGSFKGGSLTSATGFQLAVLLGCSSIAFVGHDLSWPSPDKVYAEDVFEWKAAVQKQVKFKSNCMLFPDIHGELVLTHFTFVVFWAWIRDYIKLHKTSNVYNCSEAGILQTDELKAIPFQQFLNDLNLEPSYGRHTDKISNSN